MQHRTVLLSHDFSQKTNKMDVVVRAVFTPKIWWVFFVIVLSTHMH